MILIISTCSQKLNEDEFVRPIEKLLLKNGFDFETKHYFKVSELEYDKIIICGTALKDFEYLKDIEKFSWIKDYDGKILGICSGMQIIAGVFGMKMKENVVIGIKEVVAAKQNTLINGKFKAYFLISKQPVLNNDFISLTKDDSIIKHKSKEFYGCSFHPEVINQELIVNFCKL
jgi:GMP synthase (glutamine-hydrolysing)